MAWSSVRHMFKNHSSIFAGGRVICGASATGILFSKIGLTTSSLLNIPQKVTIENPQKVTVIEKAFQEKSFTTTDDVTPEDKKPSTSSLKYTLLGMGISATLLGTYLIYEYGSPKINTEGETLVDEFSKYPIWKQYFLRGLRQIEDFTVFIQEPSRDKLLPDPVSYPYYQPPYTLVLEFTDVLAHPDWTYKTGWRFKKRPGLDYMLENLVGLYEIVVFTAEPGITIFPVIEALDQKNLISYKLVRDSTHFVEGHHIKNLDKLNRDLKKVIVVDWNSDSVKFHPDNHLNIQRWRGEDDDSALVDLTSFLKTIAHTEIDDVRDVLKFYKQYEDPLREFRNKQKEYYENEQKSQERPMGQPIKKVFDYIF
ncbi:mitochondrial import inner membrane translocase subunit TIM50-C-like [Anoplophora glabripennis]|nr:mitochondrial import inner membrane translocase subunit TIM50-C-like [Anoplophora glabripennis]